MVSSCGVSVAKDAFEDVLLRVSAREAIKEGGVLEGVVIRDQDMLGVDTEAAKLLEEDHLGVEEGLAARALRAKAVTAVERGLQELF